MNAQPRAWIQQQRSKRDARYASRLHHDERFDALRTPLVRRGLVIASVLLWLGAVVLTWWDVGAGNVFLIAAALMLGCYLLLHRAVRHVADAPDQALDERFVAVRNAAYRTSYRIVGIVTGLALLGMSLAVDERFAWTAFDLDGHHLRALLFGFAGVAIAMPTAVLAWREREV